MNILFIIKVKILVLIKWSYRSSQSCWLLSLEQFSYYKPSFNTCLLVSIVGFTPNHIPLKSRCFNKKSKPNRGWSTLPIECTAAISYVHCCNRNFQSRVDPTTAQLIGCKGILNPPSAKWPATRIWRGWFGSGFTIFFLQLKRPQPGRHRCHKMLSILTSIAPQIMAQASNCGAHAAILGFVIMLSGLYAFQQKTLKSERLFEEHI